jgi:hypothetical protein
MSKENFYWWWRNTIYQKEGIYKKNGKINNSFKIKAQKQFGLRDDTYVPRAK